MIKKHLYLSVLIICAIIFSGCNVNLGNLKNIVLPELPVEASPEPTTKTDTYNDNIKLSEQETAPQISPILETTDYDEEQLIVKITSGKELFYDPAQNKDLILTFAYDQPTVYYESNPEVSDRINEKTALLQETYYTGGDYGVGLSYGRDVMLEIATDNFAYFTETGDTAVRLDLESSRAVTVERADCSAISFLYNDYLFAGENSETHIYSSFNFSAQTGEQLSASNIFLDGIDAKDAAAVLIKFVEAPAPETEDLIKNAIDQGQWYFTSSGLSVFLQPGLLGNSDISIFTATYSELSGVLISSYIPVQKPASGAISIIDQDKYAQNSTEIIDRIDVDDNGNMLILLSEGYIYNIKLLKVQYSNNAFYSTGELWFANYMHNAGIQISAMIPEGMPNMMISFEDSDGFAHNCFISSDGINGNIALTDAEIAAVG